MPGDRPASEQQVGGVLGSRQLAAQYPVERRRLQIVTQRARLLDTAFGKGGGSMSAIQSVDVSLRFAVANQP